MRTDFAFRATLFLLVFFTTFSFCLDNQVAQLMPALRTPMLDGVMLFFTGLGGLTIGLPFIIIAVLLLEYRHKEKIAADLIVAAAIDIIVTTVIKLLVERDRPPMGQETENTMEAFMSSFPSGHSSRAFTLFGTLNYHFKKPYIFYTLAALVAFSRLYFCVHYLSDVLTGITIGYVISQTVCSEKIGEKTVSLLRKALKPKKARNKHGQ